MKIKVGQLFTRGIYGCKEENTYMVCGIIKTDEPLSMETVHLIAADTMDILESNDVKETTRGKGLDGVMTSPLWRIKI